MDDLTPKERKRAYRRFRRGKGKNLPLYVVTPIAMREDVRQAALAWKAR